MWKNVILIIGCTILLAGCSTADQATPEATPKVTPEKEITPEQAAGEIVKLLRDRDMAGLAEYADPSAGIRFTPYGHIDPEHDVTLAAEELAAVMEEDSTRLWGSYDGSGDPIELTFADYYAKFVYDKDYASAEQIGYNEIIGQGNTLINLQEIYPDAFFAEYHFKGTEKYNGMDWSSLRIVLEQSDDDDKWVCIAIIHDQWTI